MDNAAPARSRTDPSAPETRHREKLNLHKRLHSSSLRNRAFTASGKEHGYRHAAKETVQSAIDLKPPISFDRLLRRDKDKDTHDSSRGGTHHRSRQQGRPDGIDQGAEQQVAQQRPQARPQDVEKARQENDMREVELRKSLKIVEEVAMGSTRQLDDTYYAILEKASALQLVVAQLQALTEESKKLHIDFKTDTSSLHKETAESLQSFANFDSQEQSIHALVSKLGSSKSATNKLNHRLEAARLRVEAYETRENVKRDTRRIRWQISWALLTAVLVLVIATAIAKKRAVIGSRLHTAATAFDGFGNEIANPVAALWPNASPSEDAYLKKLFGDL